MTSTVTLAIPTLRARSHAPYTHPYGLVTPFHTSAKLLIFSYPSTHQLYIGEVVFSTRSVPLTSLDDCACFYSIPSLADLSRGSVHCHCALFSIFSAHHAFTGQTHRRSSPIIATSIPSLCTTFYGHQIIITHGLSILPRKALQTPESCAAARLIYF